MKDNSKKNEANKQANSTHYDLMKLKIDHAYKKSEYNELVDRHVNKMVISRKKKADEIVEDTFSDINDDLELSLLKRKQSLQTLLCVLMPIFAMLGSIVGLHHGFFKADIQSIAVIITGVVFAAAYILADMYVREERSKKINQYKTRMDNFSSLTTKINGEIINPKGYLSLFPTIFDDKELNDYDELKYKEMMKKIGNLQNEDGITYAEYEKQRIDQLLSVYKSVMKEINKVYQSALAKKQLRVEKFMSSMFNRLYIFKGMNFIFFIPVFSGLVLTKCYYILDLKICLVYSAILTLLQIIVSMIVILIPFDFNRYKKTDLDEDEEELELNDNQDVCNQESNAEDDKNNEEKII